MDQITSKIVCIKIWGSQRLSFHRIKNPIFLSKIMQPPLCSAPHPEQSGGRRPVSHVKYHQRYCPEAACRPSQETVHPRGAHAWTGTFPQAGLGKETLPPFHHIWVVSLSHLLHSCKQTLPFTFFYLLPFIICCLKCFFYTLRITLRLCYNVFFNFLIYFQKLRKGKSIVFSHVFLSFFFLFVTPPGPLFYHFLSV